MIDLNRMSVAMLSLITAVSENGVIGKDNRLPWRISSDLKRFKRLTMGHTLILGRKTFESIGKPLPGRDTVVITRSEGWHYPGVRVAHSIDEALHYASSDNYPYVGGGAQIYAMALPLAKQIHLTRVHTTIQGDVLFPEIDPEEWELTSEKKFPANAHDEYATTYQIMNRVRVKS